MKITQITNKHIKLNILFSENMEQGDIFRYFRDNLSELDCKEKGLVASSVFFNGETIFANYKDGELALPLIIKEIEVITKKVEEPKKVIYQLDEPSEKKEN